MKTELNFTTEYRQFYLSDINFIGKTDSENFWTSKAHDNKVAVENGILGILIFNDEGIVKCKLEILDAENPINEFDDFDHVVEASLKIDSGILQILDCPFSEIEFETKIEVGEYRVRIYSTNLNSAYDENPNDSYLIQIWKEEFSEPKVLKRYIG